MKRLVLAPHPALPCATVHLIEAEVERPRAGGLRLRYVVLGDIDRLRLPPPATPTRTDDLWKHTCFEAFIRPGAGPAYYELNLSPSTQWAAYSFEAERTGMRPADGIAAPRIETRASGDRYELTAVIDLDLPGDAVCRLGLSAVIEEIDGAKSYWALAHPAAKPDFHHPDAFTLDLPAPESP